MIAPLADLQPKGLLDQTLVVLGTEFGRTPRINDNDGREHEDKASGCLLAGAGIDGSALTPATSRGPDFSWHSRTRR